MFFTVVICEVLIFGNTKVVFLMRHNEFLIINAFYGNV